MFTLRIKKKKKKSPSRSSNPSSEKTHNILFKQILYSENRRLSLQMSCTSNLAEVKTVQWNDNGRLSQVIFLEDHHPTAAKQQGCSELHSVPGNTLSWQPNKRVIPLLLAPIVPLCVREITARVGTCLWASETQSQVLFPICSWAWYLLGKHWACVPAQGCAPA